MTEDAIAEILSPYGTSSVNITTDFAYISAGHILQVVVIRDRLNHAHRCFFGLISFPALLFARLYKHEFPIITFATCPIFELTLTIFSRGCAFVTYETQQEADAAVAALHGSCDCPNPPTLLLALNHAVDIIAKACRTLFRFTGQLLSLLPP